MPSDNRHYRHFRHRQRVSRFCRLVGLDDATMMTVVTVCPRLVRLYPFGLRRVSRGLPARTPQRGPPRADDRRPEGGETEPLRRRDACRRRDRPFRRPRSDRLSLAANGLVGRKTAGSAVSLLGPDLSSPTAEQPARSR
jgi:hypothetical protein